MTILPITARHAEAIAPLPYHHKDPFDRVLIAQSMQIGRMILLPTLVHVRSPSRR